MYISKASRKRFYPNELRNIRENVPTGEKREFGVGTPWGGRAEQGWAGCLLPKEKDKKVQALPWVTAQTAGLLPGGSGVKYGRGLKEPTLPRRKKKNLAKLHQHLCKVDLHR